MEALAFLEGQFLLARNKRGSWVRSALAEKQETTPGLERAIVVANWIEQNLQIALKDGGVRTIKLNDAQTVLMQYVARCWHLGLPVQILVPKARQEGVSTYLQALGFALCVLNNHVERVYRVATIAHTEESAKTIFRMSRMFEKKLPEEWAPHGNLESKQQGQIEWDHGARSRIGTARGGDAVERGATLNMIHGSEVAYWAAAGANPDTVWTAAIGALNDDRDAVLALESTANGRDPFFYRLFEESTHRPPRNTWRVIFLPWLLAPDYSMPYALYRKQRIELGWDAEMLPEEFIATPAELELREHLAGVIVAPGEEWYRYRVRLTDEQLVWRRHTIEKKFNGRLEDFQREYPSTVEEAFLATSTSLFSQETISHYWNAAERGKVGDVVTVGAAGFGFEEKAGGALELWEVPDAHSDYVIGGDPSEGLAFGDASSAFVINKRTLVVAAELHGRMDPDKFADALNALGRWFNNALLAVESTFDAGVVRRLRKKHKYPNLYWHRVVDSKSAKPTKPGFSTDRRTRTVILNVLAATCRDLELKSRSIGFRNEMNTFVWRVSKNGDKGKWAAAPGHHDDRIMAMAIGLFVCDLRGRDGRRKVERAAAPKSEAEKALEAFHREDAAQQARERGHGRGQPVVGAEGVGGPIYLG